MDVKWVTRLPSLRHRHPTRRAAAQQSTGVRLDTLGLDISGATMSKAGWG